MQGSQKRGSTDWDGAGPWGRKRGGAFKGQFTPERIQVFRQVAFMKASHKLFVRFSGKTESVARGDAFGVGDFQSQAR